jgi:hypothetical protein
MDLRMGHGRPRHTGTFYHSSVSGATAARLAAAGGRSHDAAGCGSMLGRKYDIRQFHDAMLLPGAVPLDLLERIYIRTWRTRIASIAVTAFPRTLAVVSPTQWPSHATNRQPHATSGLGASTRHTYTQATTWFPRISGKHDTS